MLISDGSTKPKYQSHTVGFWSSKSRFWIQIWISSLQLVEHLFIYHWAAQGEETKMWVQMWILTLLQILLEPPENREIKTKSCRFAYYGVHIHYTKQSLLETCQGESFCRLCSQTGGCHSLSIIIRHNHVTEINSFPLNSQDPVTQALLIVTMFGLTFHPKSYQSWPRDLLGLLSKILN